MPYECTAKFENGDVIVLLLFIMIRISRVIDEADVEDSSLWNNRDKGSFKSDRKERIFYIGYF